MRNGDKKKIKSRRVWLKKVAAEDPSKIDEQRSH